MRELLLDTELPSLLKISMVSYESCYFQNSVSLKYKVDFDSRLGIVAGHNIVKSKMRDIFSTHEHIWFLDFKTVLQQCLFFNLTKLSSFLRETLSWLDLKGLFTHMIQLLTLFMETFAINHHGKKLVQTGFFHF